MLLLPELLFLGAVFFEELLFGLADLLPPEELFFDGFDDFFDEDVEAVLLPLLLPDEDACVLFSVVL